MTATYPSLDDLYQRWRAARGDRPKQRAVEQQVREHPGYARIWLTPLGPDPQTQSGATEPEEAPAAPGQEGESL